MSIAVLYLEIIHNKQQQGFTNGSRNGWTHGRHARGGAVEHGVFVVGGKRRPKPGRFLSIDFPSGRD